MALEIQDERSATHKNGSEGRETCAFGRAAALFPIPQLEPAQARVDGDGTTISVGILISPIRAAPG